MGNNNNVGKLYANENYTFAIILQYIHKINKLAVNLFQC